MLTAHTISCPQCGFTTGRDRGNCPRCGHQSESSPGPQILQKYRGFEWKSKASILGWPLVHIAFGRNRDTGRLMMAKGIIAIGQFAVGLITFSQFGVGLVFAFGQFTAGFLAIGQLALGVYFGLGQFATGMIAIGQLAIGKYVLAQSGFGEHVWSLKTKDPIAREFFTGLWNTVKAFFST